MPLDEPEHGLVWILAGLGLFSLFAWRASANRLNAMEGRPLAGDEGPTMGQQPAVYDDSKLTGRQREVAAIIVDEAASARIPPALMLALAVTESSLRPAITGDDQKSLGLFQLQLATARQWQSQVTEAELLDPTINARIAMAQMTWLHQNYPAQTFGDYAEAWALGAKKRFELHKRYPPKLKAMARATADLGLDLDLAAVWA